MADRTPTTGGRRQKVLRAAGLTLDLESRQVAGPHGTVWLTPKECQLLAVFMSHAGQILSRKFLMSEVWHTDYLDDTRTLDVHICYLRRKIEQDPHRPRLLRTVRGVGYRFAQ